MFKKWFPFNEETTQSKRRLFCFSHSGAGATIFLKWLKFSFLEFEICPAQLPGRESRFAEKPYKNMATLISSLTAILTNHAGHQPVFFGHSLGAYIAFECGKQMQGKDATVVISAAPHPGKKKTTFVSQLPDEEFLQKIISYGGISNELIREKELLQLILPTLRADIALSEAYEPSDPSPFKGKLIAFGAREDPLVSSDDLTEWKNYVSGPFSSQFFQGDHFYYQSCSEQVLRTLMYLI